MSCHTNHSTVQESSPLTVRETQCSMAGHAYEAFEEQCLSECPKLACSSGPTALRFSRGHTAAVSLVLTLDLLAC
eukprot:6327588-Amphidinium_carterae.2